MPAAENLEIAKRYLACLSGDAGFGQVESFFAPDVEQEEFPNRLTPEGAKRDLQGLKEGHARGKELLTTQQYELINAVSTDEQVALEVLWTAIVRETAGPFAAGQALRARFAVFLEFRNGRIARQRNYDCFYP